MTINFRGHLFEDDGTPVEGATVALVETGTTTQEASTTTNAAGLWVINEADQDRYDTKITYSGSTRYIRWDDQISLKEIDVRNSTGATTPAATFTNLDNSVANQVAVFSGANSTKADDNEIYLSFKMHDSAGNLDEFARMTVVATDVTTTTEDGQIEFDVIKGGTLTKVWTISSSSAAAMSFDMNVDALTIGSGADTDISLTFDANSADGVITWMEDEDYFKFSDDILMNSTERINFYDTAIYIYSSADGQLDLVADTEIQIAATTIDINGAVALNGAITGATDITLSGELDAATLDLSSSADIAGDLVLSGGADGALQFANAGENSIKIPDNQASALIIEEADNAYITFVTTNSSEAITVAKATTFSSTIAAATGSTIGNLTLANGSITDSGGALDFGNETLTTTGVITGGGFTIGSAAISEAELEILDGATVTTTELNLIDGDTSRGTTAVASGDGILINDAGTMSMTNVDTVSTYFASHSVGGGNIVTTGALDTGSITSGFGSIDNGSSAITTTGLISGGSLDIDNVLIDGTTIGHTSDTDLLTLASGIVTVAGEVSMTTLDIGGTNVSSTAAELNILDGVTATAAELNISDGDTSATGTTVADADRVVYNDNGSMKQVAVTDLAAYFDDEITAMPNLVTTAATTVGALNSGSITSGFGSIDVGGSSVSAGSFDASDGNITNVGDIALDSLSSDAGAGITITPTTDTFFSNGTGVVFGHTAQVAVAGTLAELELLGTGEADTMFSMAAFANSAAGPILSMGKSRGTSIGSFTIVADNDPLGHILFAAADGTDLAVTSVEINAEVDDANPIGNDIGGAFVIKTRPGTSTGTGATERFRIAADGAILIADGSTVKIGATTAHATTAGTNSLSIFNGDAPVGSLTNGASFYAASGEMWVIDAGANTTQLSPHNPETREWWFNSKDVHGRVLRIHMERLMKRLDEEFGGGFIEEFIEAGD